MPDCASCRLFNDAIDQVDQYKTNRPGGLDLTLEALGQCNLPIDARVLDIACGMGATLQLLKSLQINSVFGLDISSGMTRRARVASPNTNILQADSLQIPFGSSIFDLVLMECAFHLGEKTELLSGEIWRVLQPGGKLLISDLYLRDLSDQSAKNLLARSQCLNNLLFEDEIRTNLTQAGFSIRIFAEKTQLLNQWMMGQVFRLGSVNEFYRLLLGEKTCTDRYTEEIFSSVKLGYALIICEKLPGK